LLQSAWIADWATQVPPKSKSGVQILGGLNNSIANDSSECQFKIYVSSGVDLCWWWRYPTPSEGWGHSGILEIQQSYLAPGLSLLVPQTRRMFWLNISNVIKYLIWIIGD